MDGNLKSTYTLFMQNIHTDQTGFCVREQKYPLPVQAAVTVLCAALDLALSMLVCRFRIPIYLDMLFTLFAAYFGWFPALAAPVLYHLSSPFFPYGDIRALPFLICSLTGSLIIRLFLQKNKKIEPLDLVFLSIVVSLAICIEGGIIFTAIYTGFGYMDCNPSKYLMFSLIMQHIPLFVSAILTRIPLSSIDKTISVCVSWLLMAALQKKFFTGSCRQHEAEK